MLQDPGLKQLFEWSLGQRQLLVLDSLPERQEAAGLTLGTETLEAAILWSSFYHVDTGTSHCHFGILPLAY